MCRIKIFKLIVVILITLLISCSSTNNSSKSKKVGSTVELENKNISWELYDSTSTLEKSNISYDDLQGKWSSYKGIYCFGEHVNQMNLTKPFIFEVEKENCRRNEKSEFNHFLIQGNLIINIQESKRDTGIINKITPKELTISWKDKSNYTRYYYEK